ncbi:uncharacterized protein VDAG_01088 [Verticillium dahliae VdLs.17]|uniref:Uncharacterized protein n=1 Tax=Verticillium dahliae (strain VdLs.17 / ATCC MYA-4575 / FGSC 10137) TaxID=498257 RepID=G2WTG5_VERDV|nr:uncharacterized protein VDAG_01088 [Verticillium dahliae VdLs.17]EGY17406.1 hypothetical protein VDAG_01088 [Verticillium dahliae VdLs.17]
MITNQKATPADNARLPHEETQAENDQLPSNRDISTHGLFAPPSLAGCRRQRRLPPRHRKELPVLRRLCTSVDGALLDWCFRPEPLLYQHPRPGSPGLSCHCLRNGLHVLRGRSLRLRYPKETPHFPSLF